MTDDLSELERYYGDPRSAYRDPSLHLQRGMMPTLPLASFEADRAGDPPTPSLPARALHAIADSIPQNKDLPPPQFPMDPRSMSLAAMLSEYARHSGNWADWQNKSRPEGYSPGDILAPSGGMAFASAPVGALAAGAARRSAHLPAEQSVPRLSLSDNLRPASMMTAEGYPRFMHDIFKGEDKIGYATGHIAGDTAHFNWLGEHGLENALGRSGIRELRERFRDFYPGVARFEGERAANLSGSELSDARRASGWRSGDRDQSITMRADNASGSLPGTIVNGMEQGAKPKLVPAVRVDGKDIAARGPTHSDALNEWRQRSVYADRDIPDEFWKRVEDGYVTPDGKFLNRQEAARHVGRQDNLESSVLSEFYGQPQQ